LIRKAEKSTHKYYLNSLICYFLKKKSFGLKWFSPFKNFKGGWSAFGALGL